MNIKVNYPQNEDDIKELKERGSKVLADFLIRSFSKRDISKAIEIYKSQDIK